MRQLKPPRGWPTWLDWAVETMETRSIFLQACQETGTPSEWWPSPIPQREEMEAAARAELEDLRARAQQNEG
jgi:hypothetical protein